MININFAFSIEDINYYENEVCMFDGMHYIIIFLHKGGAYFRVYGEYDDPSQTYISWTEIVQLGLKINEIIRPVKPLSRRVIDKIISLKNDERLDVHVHPSVHHSYGQTK